MAPVKTSSVGEPQEKVILLVEDSPLDVLLLCELLTRHGGFRVLTSETLQGAFGRIRAGGVDLLLCDLNLPDSGPDQTIDALMNLFSQIPVVVLSGCEDEELALQIVEKGAQDYLVKGRIDWYLLNRSLRYAMERHRCRLEVQRAREDLERRVAERTAELTDTTAKLEVALDQLRHAQQQIVQQERLRALGQMASGIAHDFNNILAPIVGYTDLLLHSDRLPPEKAIEYLRIIHTAARDSAGVVSRLREFFRYRDEHDVFAPVMLNDLVNQVVALTRPRWKDQALERGAQIEVLTDLQTVPMVLGSESELREMLVNLIFNAVDAIDGHGTVICRTILRGNSVVMQVSDTGAGMSEETRLRCFEPFYTTKAERGSGLGLAMVYGTVRRHDGEISIESAPKHGTTVSVTLLACEDSTAVDNSAAAEPRMRHLRILIVDDEPSVREVLAACLGEDGHTVGAAADGADALEKLAGEPWDLVVSDRAMPRMNGDQLAAEIKRLYPGMPVVLVTGFAELTDTSGIRSSAVDLVVRKPFTLDTLRTAIHQAVSMYAASPAPSQRTAAVGGEPVARSLGG